MMLILFIVFIIPVCLFVYNRLTCGIVKSSVCLVGKTAIVTGGNSGIGFQTSLMLAGRGCKVIIADKDDSENSKLKITKETGNPNVIVKYIDLASLKSVRKFAQDIIETEERLDILINNAGIASSKKRITEDGLNTVIQVNYLGHFLLTHLLIGLLKKTAPSRIIFTSSKSLYFFNSLNPDNLNDTTSEESYLGSLYFYGNSKMAMFLASNEFAQRLNGTGVTCNAVDPGAVRTGIMQKSYIFGKGIAYNAALISNLIVGKSPWEGAQTTVFAALDKSLENTTGKFLSDCKIKCILPKKYSSETVQQIWNKSEELIQLKETEKLKPAK